VGSEMCIRDSSERAPEDRMDRQYQGIQERP